MLICFSNHGQLNDLFRTLEIQLHGIKIVNGYHFAQYHNDQYYAYVFREDLELRKCEQIQNCQSRLEISKTIIVDFEFPLDEIPTLDCYVATSVDELEHLMCLEFDPRTKNKIQRRLFHSFQDDVLTVLQMLPVIFSGTINFSSSSSLKRVKRNRTEQCIICESTESNIMLNCGHECMCEECGNKWLAEKKECPVCRSPVERIFN